MTKVQIKRLRTLLTRIQPGPWQLVRGKAAWGLGHVYDAKGLDIVSSGHRGGVALGADEAEFIASARNCMEDLLDCLAAKSTKT